MCRCMSDKRADAATVVRHYETDTARVAKALLVVLRWCEAHPPAHESSVVQSKEEGQTEAQGTWDVSNPPRSSAPGPV